MCTSRGRQGWPANSRPGKGQEYLPAAHNWPYGTTNCQEKDTVHPVLFLTFLLLRFALGWSRGEPISWKLNPSCYFKNFWKYQQITVALLTWRKKSTLSAFCHLGYLLKSVDGRVGGRVMFALAWQLSTICVWFVICCFWLVGGPQSIFLVYVISITSTSGEQLWAPWYCWSLSHHLLWHCLVSVGTISRQYQMLDNLSHRPMFGWF